CGGYSRKQIGELEETAKTYGAKGLAWMKVTDSGGLEGGIAKFFEKNGAAVTAGLDAKPGDLLLFVADAYKTAVTALGAVRSRLGRDLGLAAEKEFNFTWIIDFPLFEYNEDEKRWEASHHLFSMPQEKYIPTLESDPGSVKGDLYDLVCNGVELASGSIRVHDPVLQERIFAVVGFSMEEAKKRFGFLLEAFRYGPPPHGGIAPGLDRLVTLIAGVQTIRDVIAFPKNTVGASPMDDAPSPVDPAQLADLHLAVIEEEKEEA
ncbi:MAG TPA: aspartate--tRNA ligase, partial [Spirochaetia bacterium]|nr:aspartate--tRNA ligase [Spirochaetia bacterium]